MPDRTSDPEWSATLFASAAQARVAGMIGLIMAFAGLYVGNGLLEGSGVALVCIVLFSYWQDQRS